MFIFVLQTVAVFLDSKAKQEVARKMNVSEISDVFSKIRKSSLVRAKDSLVVT